MNVAALFILTKNWNQSRYPLTMQWLSKLQYIHRVDYYSSIKKSKPFIHATIWMFFKNIKFINTSSIKRLHIIWRWITDQQQPEKDRVFDGTMINKNIRKFPCGNGKILCFMVIIVTQSFLYNQTTCIYAHSHTHHRHIPTQTHTQVHTKPSEN